MSSGIISEDLRSVKTEKALYAAVFSLLKNHTFKRITVKGVCEEALVSRATFYAHFIDKYDLLKHCITAAFIKNFNDKDTYEQIEAVVNEYIHENMPMLKNLVDDADNETFDILFDCILSSINLSINKNKDKEIYAKNIVLSNFYAGGLISYFLWQVKNKFPSDIPPMNKHLYDIINELNDWRLKPG